jgi:hypothetical protein
MMVVVVVVVFLDIHFVDWESYRSMVVVDLMNTPVVVRIFHLST